METRRAHSIFTIKSLNDGDRIVEGIASTPTVDRVGDIVMPKGGKFTLPMPLLWQHRSAEPVGTVEFAKSSDEGIVFRAKIAKIDEPGPLKSIVDTAWQAVKAGLVRGVS